MAYYALMTVKESEVVMAEANPALNVFVTGGAHGAGLATARALVRRGHNVLATASDGEGALAIRLAGALPVYPELSRAGELRSYLRLAKANAVVHAAPQSFGAIPHADPHEASCAEELLACAAAIARASKEHAVPRLVSLSFGYLYEDAQGAAREGDRNARDAVYAPMLEAEDILRDSGLNGFILRSAYIYGGNSPSSSALAQSIKDSRRLPAGAKPASWIHEDDLAAAIVSLLEWRGDVQGMQTLNAAADAPCSPNDFAAGISAALGLSAPAIAGAGFLTGLRQQDFRDKLLARSVVIKSAALRDQFDWQPRHNNVESGLQATALTWRLQDAVDRADYYNYQDKAAEAIAAFAYDAALSEAVAAAPAPVAAAASAPTPAAASEVAAKATAPPASDGPTPWNEGDAKREERRRKALERKAKRAARQAGGN